jgi:hypothetical protein
MAKAEIGARVIETHVGYFIDPIDPDPRAFALSDIAWALSNMCRYNGHTKRFYSVAEHSLLVADLLRKWGHGKEAALQGLMHDASEAYLPDLASPLKRDGWGAGFREAEERLMSLLSARFGFPWPMLRAVIEADITLLWCEAHVLLPSRGKTWGDYEKRGRWYIENNSDVIQWLQEGKRRFWHDDQWRAWLNHVLDAGAK